MILFSSLLVVQTFYLWKQKPESPTLDSDIVKARKLYTSHARAIVAYSSMFISLTVAAATFHPVKEIKTPVLHALVLIPFVMGCIGVAASFIVGIALVWGGVPVALVPPQFRDS